MAYGRGRRAPAMETVIGWRPEVGQRIRVRVNMECQYCMDDGIPAGAAEALADDGRTGVVAQVGHDDEDLSDHEPWAAAFLAHDIWVRWDERRPYDPCVRLG